MSVTTAATQGKQKVKVLVPINFSGKSDLVLDFALTYSHRFNADVYLFHVFEGASKDYRRLDALNEEFLDRMRRVVTQAVARLHAEGATHAVEDVYRRIASGRPWMEILKMAAGIGSDIIIMGAPKSKGFNKLVNQAPCTLVLVKEKDPTFVMP